VTFFFFAEAGGISKYNNFIFASVNTKEPSDFNPNHFAATVIAKNVRLGVTRLFNLGFTTNYVPRFYAKYFEKDSDSLEGFGARWLLLKLVEYNETDGVPGFSAGDSLLQNSYLWGNSSLWSKMVHTKVLIAGSNAYHHEITNCKTIVAPVNNSCFRTDGQVCLSVEFNTKVYRNTTTNVDTGPTTLKWGISVDNYPFADCTNNSRLALKAVFDTAYGIKDFTPADDDDVATKAGQSSLQLTGGTKTSSLVASWDNNLVISGCGSVTSAPIIKSLVFENGSSWEGQNETFEDGSAEDSYKIVLNRKVLYFSVETPSGCKPSKYDWDPYFSINFAVNLWPSLLLLIAAFFF